jgi:hypothetical protein
MKLGIPRTNVIQLEIQIDNLFSNLKNSFLFFFSIWSLDYSQLHGLLQGLHVINEHQYIPLL